MNISHHILKEKRSFQTNMISLEGISLTAHKDIIETDTIQAKPRRSSAAQRFD